jgi:hypothetical protein
MKIVRKISRIRLRRRVSRYTEINNYKPPLPHREEKSRPILIIKKNEVMKGKIIFFSLMIFVGGFIASDWKADTLYYLGTGLCLAIGGVIGLMAVTEDLEKKRDNKPPFAG